MRNELLAIGMALAAMTAANAAEEPAAKIYDLCLVSVTSPDGMVGVSDDEMGNIVIVDYRNDKLYYYNQEVTTMADGNLLVTKSYSKGMGNCLSNTGVLVGNTLESMADGSYWENGQWHSVAMPQGGSYGLQLNGISADGNVICGLVSGSGDIMGLPGVWTRDAEGDYSQFEWLPCPEKDFTGRVPQAVTPVSVSADGNVIAGQVWDYFGGAREPIVFTRDAEGKWSYKLVEPAFYGIEWPEVPGENPEQPQPEDYMTTEEYKAYEKAINEYVAEYTLPLPDPTDYMTDEQKAAYQEAYDAWDVTVEPFPPSPSDFMSDEKYVEYQIAMQAYYDSVIPYPQPDDFMTEEEYAKYSDDMDAYNREYAAWYAKFEAFQIQYGTLMETLPKFDPNNALLSDNGRYYATTSVTDYQGTAYRYDLQEGTSKSYAGDLFVNYVNGDGIMMAGTPLYGYTRTAKILENTDGDFIDGGEYVALHDAVASEWVDGHCPSLGTPCGAQDLSVIWAWTSDEEYYTTYVIPVRQSSGVEAVETASPLSLGMDASGLVSIGGEASRLTVYGLQGEVVLEVENPGATVATGLPGGTYLLKASGAQGGMAMLKVRL